MIHHRMLFCFRDLVRAAMLLALLALAPARGAEMRVWTFDRDAEGWTPQNWQSADVRGGALAGITQYDAQLVSPALDVQAEDFPEMLVRIRSDRSAGGELFFSAPGGTMSEARQINHTVTGGSQFSLLRIPLASHEQWKGPIDRVRFDPLNPAAARIEIDFIALVPQPGLLLVNGGAEILAGGVPFEWSAGPDATAASVTDVAPFAGMRALRLAGAGWWETAGLDLSFLGRFQVTGQLRVRQGGAPRWAVLLDDAGGVALPPVEGELPPAKDGWTAFAFTFDVPRRAAAARLRFTGARESVADLDAVQVRQESRGQIVSDKANEPPETRSSASPPPATSGYPATRVEVRDGVARITVDGRVIDSSQALFNAPDDLHLRSARTAGVKIWSVVLEGMGWTERGFDYTAIDGALARYLEADPEVWLLPTFDLGTHDHPWWIEAHPEARCRLEDGSDMVGDYGGGRRRLPSYGSAVWRQAYGEALQRLVRHLRESRFAPRIIGYQPCMGISWEWFHWGSQSGDLVDYSEAGVSDFRRWLTARYGTDAALQAAWHDPRASLAAAAVPRGARRRGPAHGMFFDPATQQDVLDYHRYQHEIVADSIAHFARIIKEESGGRCLVGTYYGYVMHLPETPGFCQGSGHFDLARLLRSPHIDYTMAPAAYAWRELGGTGACMTAPASVLLHGKLFWTQADLRTHWAPDIQAGFGRPAGLAGSIQAMRREAAHSLATGAPIQWYDFTQGWLFGDERLADEMARLQRTLATSRAAADWPRSAYLAVVVDEEQMGAFDPFHPPYLLALAYQQREKLLRSGVPWKCYLFRDVLEHPELLEHRAFLFLNLFRLTLEQRQFLKEKVLNSGRTVALVGPVGLADGSGFSAANTGDLLGWEIEASSAPAAPLGTFLADLPAPWTDLAGTEIGTREPFAPSVWPRAPGKATVLATGAGGRPVVLWEERPEGKLFWSACPGLSPALLRGLAGAAGLPVVSADDQAVYVGYGYVGVHADAERTVRIRLPQPAAVEELIGGRRWPAGTEGLALELQAGETRILRCR